ncbi:potassium transporter KefB [Pacificimonas flava]|uniref:Potassium transporter KefB n=2 Tax=Pacificimonas TaxID=1960290 RepID=A0A219B2B9_9SPHN|nr:MULTISPECIES: cation:proton antiporter [Pacificimonas]MBZ6378086.1 cation:proton antiporter [Pacificimonas aurantium]OWV32273.1 potassium transporter KefB [Pacificimonas flava]
MADIHSAVETIQPAVVLLGLGVGAALLSYALRLNPIVGYIALGAAISALGFSGDFEGPVVAALAEAGVMFLLFNLGLHFSLAKIREEAGNIFGFGALQMLVAGGGFTALGFLFGLEPAAAVLGGFALGLSSTAVVIGLIRERDQEDCPVGRAAQSILIFQDIAAILLLVAAGALGGDGSLGSALLLAGAKALAAFAAAVLFARFLTEPLFRLVSRTTAGEVYTATALFLALAAGWATGAAGLSLTLGAFLGGVAVAESRYKVLIQTEIEAFRGLFLGFFFMTVGIGLDISALVSSWALVLLVAALLIFLKCAFNIVAARLNGWSVPGSVQLGFLLGQGSEFALVLFAIPAVSGLLGADAVAIFVAAIALSLALTPPVSNLGRRIAGKLRSGPPDRKVGTARAPVVIVGLADHGRAVADGLREAGVEYLAVEFDRERFERAVADGYEVYYASTANPKSWDVLSMAQREAIILTTPRTDRIHELSPLVQQWLPNLARYVPVSGNDNADLDGTGVRPVDVSGARGYAPLLDAVLAELNRRGENAAA